MLHRLGSEYGRLPSNIVGIEDEWAAFQFDSAAFVFGRNLDLALQENSAKKKQLRRPTSMVVAELMGESPTVTAVKPAPKPARTLKKGDPGWEEWAGVLGLK